MTRRAGLAVLSCLALTVGGALASPARAADVAGPTVNPFSPAAGHPYRHGAVPTRDAAARMKAYRAAHAAPAASGANLRYGGGVDGIGVAHDHVEPAVLLGIAVGYRRYRRGRRHDALR